MTPIGLVAAMVLENGHRWGECATPGQWADMRALLDTPGGPRKHFWLRARGASKTFDAGASTLAMMLTGKIRAGDEAYAAAAGREQAALLARKMQAIASQTPELAGAVEVQQYRVVTKRTGAVLDVLSAELATSWGKTPRWLFIDEICNHEANQRAKEFVDSLLTSMVKRRDSVCLIGSTPGGPEHWSRVIWDAAEDDPLWRCSVTRMPAPWQDPAELESERRRLPEFMWKRLFECEWAASGDTLADDAALDACTLHDGPLEPEPGTAYVVGFDLSVSTDHTAAVVAHMGLRDGRKVVVADRVEAWIPRGGKVPLADVEAWISMAARDYNAALIVGDPWQASQMTDNLRAAGHRVQPVSLSASTQSRRAQILMRLLRDRALDLPADPVLRKEFLSLRLAEGTTPGVLRLTTDGSSAGHFDRVMALSFAAEELLARPGQSWREFNGETVECASCGKVILAAMPACRFCSAANPAYRAPVKRQAAPRPAPGSWASAYLPKNAQRCPRCETGWIDPERQQSCDRCTRGAGGIGFRGFQWPWNRPAA